MGGGAGGGAGKDGAGMGFNGAAQKALEDKILKLQEDLTAAYRLQSENSHTSLRLKEQAEKDERALLKKEEELAEKTRTVITLQATLAQEKEGAKQRHKHLEHTVDLLRAEVQASRSLAKVCAPPPSHIIRHSCHLL
jgi:small-conductance mechanosensitive channel